MEKMEELKQKAVIADNASRTAGNASMIRAVDEKVNRLEEIRKIHNDVPHHVRPLVSTFFSGHKKELKDLKDKLVKWGSAVITQYRGTDKTELMMAFAYRAEQDKEVPGGVFWVTVDGDERDAISSLAGLAEKLTLRKMDEDQRRNGNLVNTLLDQGLSERQGRWLLCLDNADDIKVRKILNDVCGISGPSRRNGWVLVTLREGQPHI